MKDTKYTLFACPNCGRDENPGHQCPDDPFNEPLEQPCIHTLKADNDRLRRVNAELVDLLLQIKMACEAEFPCREWIIARTEAAIAKANQP